MGLDIWFAEDIRNALLAANEASAATCAVIAELGMVPLTLADPEQDPSPILQTRGPGQAVTDSTELLSIALRAYREGYKAALSTLALAFGVSPQAILGGIHEQEKSVDQTEAARDDGLVAADENCVLIG